MMPTRSSFTTSFFLSSTRIPSAKNLKPFVIRSPFFWLLSSPSLLFVLKYSSTQSRLLETPKSDAALLSLGSPALLHLLEQSGLQCFLPRLQQHRIPGNLPAFLSGHFHDFKALWQVCISAVGLNEVWHRHFSRSFLSCFLERSWTGREPEHQWCGTPLPGKKLLLCSVAFCFYRK